MVIEDDCEETFHIVHHASPLSEFTAQVTQPPSLWGTKNSRRRVKAHPSCVVDF